MARTMSAVHINVGPATETEPDLSRTSGEPFRIMLLGDFGGRASRSEPRLRRDPILIDAGNFAEVMERLGTGLKFSAGGAELSLQFADLHHFHPDYLYQSLPVFY